MTILDEALGDLTYSLRGLDSHSTWNAGQLLLTLPEPELALPGGLGETRAAPSSSSAACEEHTDNCASGAACVSCMSLMSHL